MTEEMEKYLLKQCSPELIIPFMDNGINIDTLYCTERLVIKGKLKFIETVRDTINDLISYNRYVITKFGYEVINHD